MLGGILSWSSSVMEPILKWEPWTESCVVLVLSSPIHDFLCPILSHTKLPMLLTHSSKDTFWRCIWSYNTCTYPRPVVHTHTHTHTRLCIPSLALTESSGSPNVWTHAIMFSQKNNKLISFLQATACYIIGDTALSTQTGLTRPETLLTAVYGAINFLPLCFSFLLHSLSLFSFPFSLKWVPWTLCVLLVKYC